jgi:hypothetical protein
MPKFLLFNTCQGILIKIRGAKIINYNCLIPEFKDFISPGDGEIYSA